MEKSPEPSTHYVKGRSMNRLFVFCCALLLCFLPLKSRAGTGEKARVRGQVAVEGLSSYEGVIALWETDKGPAPDPRKYLIVPAHVASINSDGTYSLAAPAGRYYAGVTVRQSKGPALGPPRVGDLMFMSPDEKGGFKTITLGEKEDLDLGRVEKYWQYNGVQSAEGPGLSGRVLDEAGMAVEGVIVLVFDNPEMEGRPLSVSLPTGKDGRYIINLEKGLTVFLRIKQQYGFGGPQAGGMVGVYGGQTPVGVEVKDVPVSGVDIAVMRIPEDSPVGTRREEKGRQSGPK